VDFKEENEIENARLVTDHFGYWPSFHDSEILTLRFHRDLDKSLDSMEMRVYAFEMTDKVIGNHYELIKHCFVDFEFIGLEDNEIDGFNHQNAMSGLNFGRRDDFLFCELSSAYGVDGYIEARKIRINKLEPTKD
tara:strand:+ start:70 stop:474 length:405 start_codon:yes stop_codon:yes gene_type:complete